MGSKRKRVSKEAGNSSQPSTKRPKQALESNEQPVASTRPEAPELIEKAPFVETPTGDERKREAYLYDFLGSEDINERINAADVIVSSLFGEECVPESVLLRHLEQRLFRGLASGRKASRLGFSLVLTEILGQLFGDKDLAETQYHELSFEKVLGILVEKTDVGGNLPGLEERDHYFGQLFGLECFVRAGILFAEKSRWAQVLDLLIKMAQKKVWLRRQCGWIILQAIPHMKKKTAEKTLQKLSDDGLAQTSEGVAIWLQALARFPKMEVPAKPWRDPLALTSFSSLPAILKDSGRDNTIGETPEAQRKQSNWTAQLHFVWDFILASFILRAEASAEETSKLFEQFWNRVVDEGFFSKNASEAQKFSGFMVFQLMLEGSPELPFIVKTIFSKNLMSCLMNQSAKEDRYLHRAAVKALKAIETEVEKRPHLIEPVLRNLLGNHGSYNFDQRTSSKTVEKVLQNTTPANLQSIMGLLNLKDPSKSGLEYTKYLQTLGNYLFKVASLPPSESSGGKAAGISVAATALEALSGFAYSSSLPESVREGFRARLTSAFAKFVQRPEDIGHLCTVILSIPPPESGDNTVKAACQQATKRLRSLNKAKKATTVTKALALLYAIAVLQFYNEDADAIELFKDLEKCYNKLGDAGQGSEGTSEFLVEILLAMVAQPSSLMRQVSQQVFDAFTHLMSADGIKLLTEPLGAEENEKGQRSLFSTEEDEDLGDAEEAENSDIVDLDDLDSDVDIAELLEGDSLASEDEPEDDSDSDEEDEEDDVEEEALDAGETEELEALGAALDEVLSSSVHKKEGHEKDDDSDMSDMTDSEMMALDEKLAAVFRNRTKKAGKKQARKDAKDTVVNFKHRVLDLVAIFVKKEATLSNPIAFEVLLPLLQLVRTTSAKPLSNKAQEILLNFSKGLKKARTNNIASQAQADAGSNKMDIDIDADGLLRLLKELHVEASKDTSHNFAKAASAASLAVSSALCASTDKTEEVFQLYAQTQLAWYRKEVKVQMAFFQDWLNWCQSHAAAASAASTAPPQTA
ncbi:hypothetical protein GQ53DRAFT_719605 [Thozetella sp. PMI_491]|nr:hypothetical protein GQ53DRAFT_719605 [Thozetella sp. PMI_491]